MTDHLEMDSRFFKKEIQPLIKHYDQTHISIYGIPNTNDALELDKYKEFLKDGHSCVVEEMKTRL